MSINQNVGSQKDKPSQIMAVLYCVRVGGGGEFLIL